MNEMPKISAEDSIKLEMMLIEAGLTPSQQKGFLKTIRNTFHKVVSDEFERRKNERKVLSDS